MSDALNIAPDLSLPVDAVTQTFAILGKRGRGKTNTAVVLVEEILDAGQQAVVVDTVGAWWGLRSSADGQAAGREVVIFGGLHADVPLEEGAGKIIAGTILEHGISAVVDTSLLTKAAARRFAYAFVTELYHRKGTDRRPLHVVFDEADELAPQQHRGDAAQLLGAMEDFVRRGRIRGLGCTLVTQRPASLNKDVLTQAEVLISMGMTGPRDVAAIDEWVRLHADEAQAREVKQSLASLPVGTAWVWSPEWLETLQKVQIRPRTTFDSSATPKVGQTVTVPVERAPIDLDALGAEIAATVEKAKAEDPRELRRRIAELERQLADERARPAQTEQIEVRVLSPEDAARIDALRDELETFGLVLDALAPAPQSADRDRNPWRPERIDRLKRDYLGDASDAPAILTTRPAPAQVISGDGKPLSKAQRAVLTVLAQRGTQTAQQVAMLTGYAVNGGGFNNAISASRTAGHLTGTKDALTITDEGFDALGSYEPLPTGRALVNYWLTKCGKAERLILDALIHEWPNSIDRDNLAAITGYAPNGGGFNNAISRLRTLTLIHGTKDALTANDNLGEANQ